MSQARPGKHPRSVLVTGGAGFIGSHLVDRYLTEGCRVTALDDLSSGRRERVPAGARFVEMGLNDDSLDGLFAEERFDLVNHHAAQIDVRVSVRDPREDARTNVTGLLNLLECARRHGAQLMLAGHTHGGQVCVPGYGALVTNCDIPRTQVKGLSLWRHGLRSAYLHVSAGLGTSIYAPIRFACPPEATLLTLTAARPDRAATGGVVGSA